MVGGEGTVVPSVEDEVSVVVVVLVVVFVVVLVGEDQEGDEDERDESDSSDDVDDDDGEEEEGDDVGMDLVAVTVASPAAVEVMKTVASASVSSVCVGV